jgi:hypothetical protein
MTRIEVLPEKQAIFETILIQELAQHQALAAEFRPSIWVDCDDPDRYVSIRLFESHEEIDDERQDEDFLKTRYPMYVATLAAPQEIVELNPREEVGRLLARVPTGAFMSVSERIASPGFEKDLREETQLVLDSLEAIDGYLGGFVTQREMLESEVFGFAFWSTHQAFLLSLPSPDHRIVTVRCYRRVV